MEPVLTKPQVIIAFAVLDSLARTVKLVSIVIINGLHNNFLPYKIVHKDRILIEFRGFNQLLQYMFRIVLLRIKGYINSDISGI